MNDEIVKLDRTLHLVTYGEGAFIEIVQEEWEGHYGTRLRELSEAVHAFVVAQPGRMTTFGGIRDELLKSFFGLVKQGAYSNVVKKLVNEGRLVREQRPAAKLEPHERISVPPTPVVVSTQAARAA